jgi:hypothetical protein
VTFTVPAGAVRPFVAVAHFWPGSVWSTQTLRLRVGEVVDRGSSCLSMPLHEDTELPERGGNDGGVPRVVPAVDEDELMPPAAYPRSARNRMNRMKPNAESVESSAMLCLDRLDQ